MALLKKPRTRFAVQLALVVMVALAGGLSRLAPFSIIALTLLAWLGAAVLEYLIVKRELAPATPGRRQERAERRTDRRAEREAAAAAKAEAKEREQEEKRQHKQSKGSKEKTDPALEPASLLMAYAGGPRPVSVPTPIAATAVDEPITAQEPTASADATGPSFLAKAFPTLARLRRSPAPEAHEVVETLEAAPEPKAAEPITEPLAEADAPTTGPSFLAKAFPTLARLRRRSDTATVTETPLAPEPVAEPIAAEPIAAEPSRLAQTFPLFSRLLKRRATAEPVAATSDMPGVAEPGVAAMAEPVASEPRAEATAAEPQAITPLEPVAVATPVAATAVSEPELADDEPPVEPSRLAQTFPLFSRLLKRRQRPQGTTTELIDEPVIEEASVTTSATEPVVEAAVETPATDPASPSRFEKTFPLLAKVLRRTSETRSEGEPEIAAPVTDSTAAPAVDPEESLQKLSLAEELTASLHVTPSPETPTSVIEEVVPEIVAADEPIATAAAQPPAGDIVDVAHEPVTPSAPVVEAVAAEAEPVIEPEPIVEAVAVEPESEPIVVAEPVAKAEPVVEAAAVEPEPVVEPLAPLSVEQVFSLGPRQWNLWQLEKAAESESDPYKNEELGFLLYSLREYASPDGTLPEQFDALVRESFGHLIGA